MIKTSSPARPRRFSNSVKKIPATSPLSVPVMLHVAAPFGPTSVSPTWLPMTEVIPLAPPVLRDIERVLYFESYVVIEPGLTDLEEGQLLTDDVGDLGSEGRVFVGRGRGFIFVLQVRVQLEEVAPVLLPHQRLLDPAQLVLQVEVLRRQPRRQIGP